MKVKFFAHLQNAAGCEELALFVPGGITGDDLWRLLEEKIPGFSRYKNSTRLARNFVYAEPDAVFHAGDEVALIPPVSGG
ncbi:MAG: MoaD/ThiS family protein [Chthoniobacteraceae bacterium]